jgi:hypothetical protein
MPKARQGTVFVMSPRGRQSPLRVHPRSIEEADSGWPNLVKLLEEVENPRKRSSLMPRVNDDDQTMRMRRAIEEENPILKKGGIGHSVADGANGKSRAPALHVLQQLLLQADYDKYPAPDHAGVHSSIVSASPDPRCPTYIGEKSELASFAGLLEREGSSFPCHSRGGE